MSHFAHQALTIKCSVARPGRASSKLSLLVLLLLVPLAAHAQGSPFDNGFTALQTLFTGTVAKVASLIAIVIGGYQFAHGEPGGKVERRPWPAWRLVPASPCSLPTC